METIIAGKQVVSRWREYRSAYESARNSYTAAYRDAYEEVQRAVGATLKRIKSGRAYEQAPDEWLAFADPQDWFNQSKRG